MFANVAQSKNKSTCHFLFYERATIILLRAAIPNRANTSSTLQQDQPEEDDDDERHTARGRGESRRRASAFKSGRHFPQMSLALVPIVMDADLRKLALAKRQPHVAIHKAGQSMASMRRSSCHMPESRLRRCGRGAVRAVSVSTLSRRRSSLMTSACI